MEHKSYEYIVKQRAEGAVLLSRILVIVGYIALPVLAALVAGRLDLGADVFFTIMVMALGIDAIVIFLTWRFLKVEFESCISGDRLTVDIIRGGMHRKCGIELDIRSLTEAGLFTVEASERLEEYGLNRDYVFISSLDSESIYYALFADGNELCAVYFETTPEGFSQIKRINSAAVRRAFIPLTQLGRH